MKIGKPQLLYAAKLFISAMLAFALAESIGLQNPYWAMVTCCVLSNPVSGAVRARATYRFCGTLFAGVLTLGLSAWLSNTPVLLIVAAGLSSSLMLGLSYLDRTPRAYFFQLGALTMMLVAIAYINHPDTMFTMVVTRVTEICLGILAVTLVDSVLFPSSLAPVLRTRLQGWLADLARWQEDSLDGKGGDAQADADRIRLLGDIASFNQMMTTLGYDSSVDKPTRQAAISIQQRVLQIVPLLSAIGSSIAALPVGLRPRLQPWLNEVRRQAVEPAPHAAPSVSLLPPAASLSPWETLIVDELAEQVEQWLTLWVEVQQLNAFLDGEPLPAALQAQMMRSRVFSPPPDTSMAVRMRANVQLASSQRENRRYQALQSAISQQERDNRRDAQSLAKANLDQALADRALARINLQRADLYAPVDGVITNFSLRPGAYATAGQPIMALVDSNSFYIAGYFEETKLGRIQNGDKVVIRIMGERQPLYGHVDGLSAGINDSERTTAAGNLLANVNPTFSWIRLAQRIPVRIAIDTIPHGVELIAGRTATVSLKDNGE
ncbi:FUSC family protein [Serratia marcescens]|uniref:FUSC family protein n=2 Tax=Enterobacterales TaxID=91347 RepID=UPI0034E275E2